MGEFELIDHYFRPLQRRRGGAMRRCRHWASATTPRCCGACRHAAGRRARHAGRRPCISRSAVPRDSHRASRAGRESQRPRGDGRGAGLVPARADAAARRRGVPGALRTGCSQLAQRTRHRARGWRHHARSAVGVGAGAGPRAPGGALRRGGARPATCCSSAARPAMRRRALRWSRAQRRRSAR